MSTQTNNFAPKPLENRTTAQLRAIARALRDREHTFEDRRHLLRAEIARIEALVCARRLAGGEAGEESLGMDLPGFLDQPARPEPDRSSVPSK
ncbi:MAG TPA: hypothetical protein VGI81_29550 [Tepidisphaeraceae bacterium]|jgi:hypothetical protein